MKRVLYVEKEVLDSYRLHATKKNNIRKFYSNIFKSMPNRKLLREAKKTFIDLEYSIEVQKDFIGFKTFQFKPKSCSQELKEFFQTFIVCVKVTHTITSNKKQVSFSNAK